MTKSGALKVLLKVRTFLMQDTSMVSFDGGSASKFDDVTALPSHIQDGGYALLWQRYDNNKMAAIFYIFNSTVVELTCFLLSHKINVALPT